PTRRNANRRSPSSPCHPRNADSLPIPAIDLTGYRTNSTTRPIGFVMLIAGRLAQAKVRPGVHLGIEIARRLLALDTLQYPACKSNPRSRPQGLGSISQSPVAP